MNLQKLAEFLRFFLCELLFSCHKTQKCYPIVLKFGTQQDGVRVHHGTKFGCNTIKIHKVKSIIHEK